MKKTNEKKEFLTEMVFILDKSGSMCGLESDTIGGFNSLIKKQQTESGKCVVTTVLFSDSKETVHDRIPLEQISPMTENDYTPMGCTALFDSVGSTISHIASVHRYIRKEDVPDKTVFVIITDGYENASREFTHKALKKLIEQKKKKDNWEFMFIGANIDACKTAQSIGISKDMFYRSFVLPPFSLVRFVSAFLIIPPAPPLSPTAAKRICRTAPSLFPFCRTV